jgi:predicted regulator of Ras-like GTPase activity (Roadblock/LC7/MglB family)
MRAVLLVVAAAVIARLALTVCGHAELLRTRELALTDELTGVPNRRAWDARLDAVLREFVSSSTDIEAAAVVSFDGLPMASALPDGMQDERIAAMSAALLSLGERASQGLGRGELSQVFIEGEHGYVFLLSADDEAVLVSVAGRGVKLGLALWELRQVAAEVAATLRAPAAAATPPAAAEPSQDDALVREDDPLVHADATALAGEAFAGEEFAGEPFAGGVVRGERTWS